MFCDETLKFGDHLFGDNRLLDKLVSFCGSFDGSNVFGEAPWAAKKKYLLCRYDLQ